MALLYAVAVFFYLAAQKLSSIPPQYLPFTWLDHVVPFVPTTIWIYVSEYFFFVAVFFSISGERTLNEYFYSLVMLQIICIPIFFLWPTIFPRGLFPLPNDLDSMSHWIFTWLRETDSPANCFPSLHVSGVILSALVLRESRRIFIPFMIWALAIACSTLTTKQHYFADVVAGLFVAALIHLVMRRFVAFKRS